MATVNQYTKHSNARYTPRTLQELMLVPAYKRDQHDTSAENIAVAETELAKLDALDIHTPGLLEARQKLQEQLNAQSTKLENEGFNQSSKRDFLNFNKKYQNAIGPQGEIGKRTSALEAFERERGDYITNSTALGYSPDQAAKNWEEFGSQYTTKFGEDGKVEDIGSLYAPNYYNVVDEVDKRATEFGVSTEDLGTISSYIVPDPDNGGSFILTDGWEDLVSDQKGQAKNLANWITTQINNPNSSIGQSIAHQGKSPEAALSEIQGLAGIYTSDQHRNRISSQISGRMAPSKSEGADIGKSFYTHSSQTTPIGDDYSDKETNADETLNALDASDSDIAKARQVKNILYQVDQKLQGNSTYVNAQKSLQNIWDSADFTSLPKYAQETFLNASTIDFTSPLNPFGILTKQVETISQNGEDNDLNSMTYSNGKPIPKSELNQAVQFAQKYASELEENTSLMNKMRDDAVSTRGFERTSIVVPYVKTAEKNLQMLNALQGYTADNIRPEDVLFYGADGENERVDLSEDAALRAVGLFQNSDPSDIRSIVPAKQGTSTGFVITFKPKDGSSLNPTKGVKGVNDQLDFTGSESLEMFIPVNKMYDGATGARSTSSMFMTRLPKEVQAEFLKYMATSDLSATPTFSTLGKPQTRANQFFNGTDESVKLDFLRVNEGTKFEEGNESFLRKRGEYVVPYTIKEGVKKPMNWNNFVPPGDLEEQDAFLQNFKNSGAFDVLLKGAEGDPALVKQFKLNSLEPDHLGLIEYSRGKEVRLSNTSDIYTLGYYHNVAGSVTK